MHNVLTHGSYMSIGKKINEFEAQPEQILSVFNQVFAQYLPAPVIGLDNAEVEIGEIVGPANVRKLLINGEEVVQEFRNVNQRNWDDIDSSEEGENTVISDKEIAQLEPIEYMTLQYLRGCQSQYHTQRKISENLNKSIRNMREVFKRLENKGVIEVKNIPSKHKMLVTINEEWL